MKRDGRPKETARRNRDRWRSATAWSRVAGRSRTRSALGPPKTNIQRSGRSEAQIEIRFTGLRPGETLHEEVFTSDEMTDRSVDPSARVATARPVAVASLDARVDTACGFRFWCTLRGRP
jgi:hypothetical protein